MPRRSPDVVVAGGGIVGLAVAWRAARHGLRVTVLERDAIGERCATRVAAGMLAPVSEVDFGEAGRRALELGLAAARVWPQFAAELAEAGGVDVGLRRGGTLLLARDGDEARALERQQALRESLGLPIGRLAPSAARALEPALAPTVRLALEAPEDHSVDPRCVLRALRVACDAAGVELREHAPVAAVVLGGDAGPDRSARVEGVALRDGTRVAADRVVLAAGAWSAELEGLPGWARVPVRPLKGQILRLRDPQGPGLVRRVLRFEGGYLVPRVDGGYVLGATMEERGFEPRPTAGGVHGLLRDARELVPGVDELEIEELAVGFRPTTPDNIPALGLGALPGLLWATGHHRNGILLAPLSAELLAEALAGEDRGGALGAERRRLLSSCDPLRFLPREGSTQRVHAGAVP